MTHRSEDELLAYALEALASDSERADIAAHLAECSDCRARLENIERDIKVIGTVTPRRRVLRMRAPRPRQTVTYAILRAAALIVVGFVVGLGASNQLNHEPVFVSPAYVKVSPPPDGLTAHSVSDATDVSVRYYEQVLEVRE